MSEDSNRPAGDQDTTEERNRPGPPNLPPHPQQQQQQVFVNFYPQHAANRHPYSNPSLPVPPAFIGGPVPARPPVQEGEARNGEVADEQMQPVQGSHNHRGYPVRYNHPTRPYHQSQLSSNQPNNNIEQQQHPQRGFHSQHLHYPQHQYPQQTQPQRFQLQQQRSQRESHRPLPLRQQVGHRLQSQHQPQPQLQQQQQQQPPRHIHYGLSSETLDHPDPEALNAYHACRQLEEAKLRHEAQLQQNLERALSSASTVQEEMAKERSNCITDMTNEAGREGAGTADNGQQGGPPSAGVAAQPSVPPDSGEERNKEGGEQDKGKGKKRKTMDESDNNDDDDGRASMAPPPPPPRVTITVTTGRPTTGRPTGLSESLDQLYELTRLREGQEREYRQLLHPQLPPLWPPHYLRDRQRFYEHQLSEFFQREQMPPTSFESLSPQAYERLHQETQQRIQDEGQRLSQHFQERQRHPQQQHQPQNPGAQPPWQMPAPPHPMAEHEEELLRWYRNQQGTQPITEGEAAFLRWNRNQQQNGNGSSSFVAPRNQPQQHPQQHPQQFTQQQQEHDHSTPPAPREGENPYYSFNYEHFQPRDPPT